MRNDGRTFSYINSSLAIVMRQVCVIILMTLGVAVVVSCDAIFMKQKPFASADKLHTEHDIDSSINKYLLMDSVSFMTIPSDLLHSCRIDNHENGEGVYLTNLQKNEYLFVRFNPGGMGKEFDTFILTDTIQNIYAKYLLPCNDSSFITTNGAYLGMSLCDFKLRYHYVQKPDNKTYEYYRYDTINMIYNKYVFNANVLTKIEIGYDW